MPENHVVWKIKQTRFLHVVLVVEREHLIGVLRERTLSAEAAATRSAVAVVSGILRLSGGIFRLGRGAIALSLAPALALALASVCRGGGVARGGGGIVQTSLLGGLLGSVCLGTVRGIVSGVARESGV
eukprot:CAMPEP_0119467072 /NCGR_PEP_ID=MMETSP1344-20130328/1431_1 /TAXON_ID=236787 /ORGANISM="Florenciella parvula, Strain CCMP2471" /LENGTH=127 /DNA_ID=CAMNT_0007499415 /DNA_START=420 /DNA_END=803 /DNA_ORIENTATION=-